MSTDPPAHLTAFLQLWEVTNLAGSGILNTIVTIKNMGNAGICAAYAAASVADCAGMAVELASTAAARAQWVLEEGPGGTVYVVSKVHTAIGSSNNCLCCSTAE